MINHKRICRFADILLVDIRRPGLARTLVTATLGSVVVRFGGMALTFIVGMLLARMLGTEQYGVYGTVMSLVALLAVLAQLGLPQLATREISTAMASGDYVRMRSATVWFSLIVLAGSAVMIAFGVFSHALFLPNVNGNLERAFIFGLGNVPVVALIALFMGILRGLHQIVSSQSYDAILRPSLLLLAILAGTLVGSPMDAVTALGLQFGVGTIAMFICVFHIFTVFPSDSRYVKSVPMLGNWMKSAFPMSGTEILRVIDGHYPILLLGMLAPMSDVGLFRVALAMAAFLGLPATIINLVVMPHVARLYAEGDMDRLQQIAGISAFVCFTSVTIMTLGVLLIGKPALQVFFGFDYIGAWEPLLLIGVAYAASGFFGSAATILNMAGQEKAVTIAFSLSPIIGIPTTAALYPSLGIAAAGIAMIASYLCQGLFMYLIAKNRLQIYVSMQLHN